MKTLLIRHIHRIQNKGKRKVQGMPQTQTAAFHRHQEEEETDKSKQAQKKKKKKKKREKSRECQITNRSPSQIPRGRGNRQI